MGQNDPDQYTRIIRGNFHQGDERFDWLSRGKQSVAVSIVALSFFKFNESPATWKTNDIDNILILGDNLYHASFKKMKREGTTPQAEFLLISEVYSFIKIGRQYYRFDRMDKDEDEKNTFNFNNLVRSLNRFFIVNKNHCGIFTWNIYSFAIMLKSNSVFLFNSYPTSYAGDPMDVNDTESAACVMEMLTLNCLANHLLTACKQERSDNSECYSLIKIFIEKTVFGKDILLRQKVNRDLCVTKKNTGGAERKNWSGFLEEVSTQENVQKCTLRNHALVRILTFFDSYIKLLLYNIRVSVLCFCDLLIYLHKNSFIYNNKYNFQLCLPCAINYNISFSRSKMKMIF